MNGKVPDLDTGGLWLWTQSMKLKSAAAVGAAALGAGTAYDLTQRRHAILRNYPVVGHLRFSSSGSDRSCASTS